MTEEEKKPLKVYTIVSSEKKDSKDFWQLIGRAYENKDGSLNVKLNALPTNGQLHIREASEPPQPTADGEPKE